MATPLIDFSPAAGDYARHRPGFPAAFFDQVSRCGIGIARQRVLDLGTGTGALARGFAGRGCNTVGLDPSLEMLKQAVALDSAAGVPSAYVRAFAESLSFKESTFDVVCAGQCWHWFDRERVATEATRVLRPGGFVVIAYLNYLVDPGTLGAATEAVILRHNPSWPFAGQDGRYPFYVPDLTEQGLEHVDTFDFEMEMPFSHQSWRGRVRTCNAVLTLSTELVAAFDAELADLLARDYPDPLQVPHRVFGIVARKPAT